MKKIHSYNKIRTYLKLNKKIVILFAITGTLFNVAVSFLPTVQGYIIDEFVKGKSFNDILKMCIVFMLFVLFVQVNRFMKRLLRRRFNNKMVIQMRSLAFSNLLKMPIDEFDKNNYGDIMNKQLSDIKDASSAIETCVAETFDSGVLLISYFIFMGLMNWKLAIICMLFAFVSVFISVFFGPLVRKFTRDYKKTYSLTKKENITVLQNEIYYRGFGINGNYYDEYKNTLNKLEKRAVKNTIFRTSFEPLYLGIAALGYVFAIYYGSKYYFDGIWELGTFTAFITSFTLARKKCGNVGRIINNTQNGFVAWERCKVFLNVPYKQNEISVNSNLGLNVNNLTFGYDDKFELKNVNFNANYGEIIGVCGKIRSGKTTLVGALSGIYEYEGSIKLAGIELKEYKNDMIKNFIHIAPGIVEIFNDTLEYNITFKNDGDFEKTIKSACLEDDIASFKNGKNEILSHSLLNISGGQQRRLQIARAIYSSPRLVVLDDPFNARGNSSI